MKKSRKVVLVGMEIKQKKNLHPFPQSPHERSSFAIQIQSVIHHVQSNYITSTIHSVLTKYPYHFQALLTRAI